MQADPSPILSDDALQQVAGYFQALSEPARLYMLRVLQDGPCSVGELAQRAACSPANASRHLAHLAQWGLVARQSRGNSVYYALADPTVHALCDLVCTRMVQRYQNMQEQHKAFAAQSA